MKISILSDQFCSARFIRQLTDTGYLVAQPPFEAEAINPGSDEDHLILVIVDTVTAAEEMVKVLRNRGSNQLVFVIVRQAEIKSAYAARILNAGSDDVQTKLHISELLARIKALFDRQRSHTDHLKFETLCFDRDSGEGWEDGPSVTFTKGEAIIMCALIKAQGRCVSKLQIHQLLYPIAADSPHSKTVNVLVYRIRKKLKRVSSFDVACLWGRGYYLARRKSGEQAA